MTIPVWALIISAVGTALGSGGLGAILVKMIEGRNELPAHLNAELVRLSDLRERDRQRLDSVEAHLVLLGDHVDLLESHIWNKLPPPPPARPIYRPQHPKE